MDIIVTTPKAEMANAAAEAQACIDADEGEAAYDSELMRLCDLFLECHGPHKSLHLPIFDGLQKRTPG